MKRLKLGLLYAALAAYCVTHAVVPTYRIRPQGVNRLRELVGLTNNLYIHNDDDRWNGNLYFVPFFNHSFNAHQIGRQLFGCDAIKCDDRFIIKVQGMNYQGENRDPRAWLADNFFLNTTFSSELSFKPVIKNTGLDMGFYLELDPILKNTYIRGYMPIVHTNWNLNLQEQVLNPGGYNVPLGILAPIDIALLNIFVFQSAEQFFSGQGITMNAPGLQFTRMTRHGFTHTSVADITLEIGYTPWHTDKGHFGLYFQGIIPTGSRVNTQFLFSPHVGNNHHWGIGFGISGHRKIWENMEEDRELSFHADINLSHLFGDHQLRTFDLKNKPNSRYMLASHFFPNTGFFGVPIEGNGIPASSVYVPFPIAFTPVANLTTTDVKVSVGIQADIVAMANYTHRNWSFDLGYNFWAQSCEKIEMYNRHHLPVTSNAQVSSLFNTDSQDLWALKGDARIWGWRRDNGESLTLSATQSEATINNGTNKIPINLTPLASINQGVDNPLPATVNGGTVPVDILPTNAIQVNTSLQPVLLSRKDVDVQGSRGMSNKLFGNITHAWPHEHVEPLFSMGGEIEWGSGNASAKCCPTASLSQWGVWFKGSICFN